MGNDYVDHLLARRKAPTLHQPMPRPDQSMQLNGNQASTLQNLLEVVRTLRTDALANDTTVRLDVAEDGIEVKAVWLPNEVEPVVTIIVA